MSVVDHETVHSPAPNRVPVGEPVALSQEPLHLVAEPGDLVEAAIDILMVRHQVSREVATDLLTQASDGSGRLVSEVAREVVLLGLPSVGTQIELRSEPGPDATGAGEETAETIAATLLLHLVDITDLPGLLTAVAELAVQVVPGCEAAGVAVLSEGAPATVGAVDLRVRDVDELQYRDGDGPYLQVAHTQSLVRIDDISSLPMGGAWARAALEAGFRAVLSVPIVTDTDIAATISLYATHTGGWSEESLIAAAVLAEHAGHAIAVAQRLMTSS
jgi:GAF domain-containing protein